MQKLKNAKYNIIYVCDAELKHLALGNNNGVISAEMGYF